MARRTGPALSNVTQKAVRNVLAGQAAERAVERVYVQAGCRVMERRWRTRDGEIDLILSTPQGVILFVEVKSSTTIARARQRISPRQARRILAAGMAFLGTQPKGQLSDVRFDAGFVDAQGRVEIMENVLSEDMAS